MEDMLLKKDLILQKAKEDAQKNIHIYILQKAIEDAETRIGSYVISEGTSLDDPYVQDQKRKIQKWLITLSNLTKEKQKQP